MGINKIEWFERVYDTPDWRYTVVLNGRPVFHAKSEHERDVFIERLDGALGNTYEERIKAKDEATRKAMELYDVCLKAVADAVAKSVMDDIPDLPQHAPNLKYQILERHFLNGTPFTHEGEKVWIVATQTEILPGRFSTHFKLDNGKTIDAEQ